MSSILGRREGCRRRDKWIQFPLRLIAPARREGGIGVRVCGRVTSRGAARAPLYAMIISAPMRRGAAWRGGRPAGRRGVSVDDYHTRDASPAPLSCH